MPDLIYLDNAATSFPKPPEVLAAMVDFARERGVNPGRAGFDLALAAGRDIEDARRELDAFFNNPAGDPDRLVFAFNATDALNTLIQGLCRPGDHVISTVTEHNSVLRPLKMLADSGIIEFDLARCDSGGYVDPQEIRGLIRPETRLVVVNHGSNVIGTVQPVAEIGALCRERDILMAIDAAQTAGVVEIDMAAMNIDVVAFTGHKSLLGPTGTGGLAVGPRADIRPTCWGGTGVKSAQRDHPDEFPWRLEAGTLNSIGIAGLREGLAHVARAGGPARILAAEMGPARMLRSALEDIPGIEVLGEWREGACLPVLSCTVAGLDPSDVGAILDVDHDIAVRTGLHCAPLIHQALGTGERGAVRFSFGPGSGEEDARRAAGAMAEIAAMGRSRI